MDLGSTEYQGLLFLIDHVHEEFDSVRLPFTDLDHPIEVLFAIPLVHLDLSLDQDVIGSVDVVIQGGGELLDLERGEVAIVDPVFQRVDIHRFAEIDVGVGIPLTFGSGGQSELNGWPEVLHDLSPVALIVCPATVTLVDDDEVEEVRGIVAKAGSRVPLGIPPGHEGLEDGEEDAAVLGHPAFFPDGIGRDPHKGILGKGGEGIVGLVCEDVTVCQEEDARSPPGFLSALPVLQVPLAVEELPGQLESDEGLARAGGQGQQDAVSSCGNGFQGLIDGIVLVIASLKAPASVFKGDGGETIPPTVGCREGLIPKLIGSGIAGDITLCPCLHVGTVNPETIGRVGESRLKFGGVAFGLGETFRIGKAGLLGLDDCQLMATIDQHIVGDIGFAPFAATDNAPRSDDFTPDLALIQLAPTCRHKGRVYEFCSGFGFVEVVGHQVTCYNGRTSVSSPVKAFWRIDCLSSEKAVSFCW